MVDLCEQEGIAFLPWAPIQEADATGVSEIAAQRIDASERRCARLAARPLAGDAADPGHRIGRPPGGERGGGRTATRRRRDRRTRRRRQQALGLRPATPTRRMQQSSVDVAGVTDDLDAVGLHPGAVEAGAERDVQRVPAVVGVEPVDIESSQSLVRFGSKPSDGADCGSPGSRGSIGGCRRERRLTSSRAWRRTVCCLGLREAKRTSIRSPV